MNSENSSLMHFYAKLFTKVVEQIAYIQRWATATLKIASLPSLFAENNSGASSPVREQK